MQVRRVAVAATTIALALPALAGSAAAAGQGTKQVNRSGHTSGQALQIPVAGSTNYLAYLLQPTEFGTRLLEVRDAAGKTADYGRTIDRTFSLSQGMLTASPHINRQVLYSRAIDWWNLKTGKSGRLAIPKGDLYLGSAPGGVLLSTSTDTIAVSRMSLSGKTTDLGTLPAAPRHVLVSDSGFAVNTYGATARELRYQAWADPGSFTQLQTGATDFSNLPCNGMSATYIACIVGGSRTPTLIRLDGGAPAATSPAAGVGAAVAGSTVLYPEGPDSEAGSWTIGSETAGDVAPQTSTTGVEIPVVSAYGEAVFEGADQSLIAATDATHQTVIVPTQPRVASAREFALTPGRIVWDDNLPNPAHPGDAETVRQRAVHATAHHLSLGKPVVLGRLPDGESGYGPHGSVQAGQKATAWEDDTPDTQTVTARSPFGTFHLDGNLVGVSNRWLVTRPAIRTLDVLDMKRNKTRSLSVFPADAAVSANRLAVLRSNGKLQVTNLATGHRTTIATSKRAPLRQRIDEIFFTGHWLGWNDGKGLGRARNVATMRPAVGFKRPIATLGRHDAVLVSYAGRSTYNYYVSSYHGRERKVLSHSSPWAPPQIDGHVFAWISALGQVEAMPLALPR